MYLLNDDAGAHKASIFIAGTLIARARPRTKRVATALSKFQAKERVQEVEAKWITDKAALDARLLELVKEREKMESEFETQKGNWTRTMGKTYENRPFLLSSAFR